jgi:hypothetical protein
MTAYYDLRRAALNEATYLEDYGAGRVNLESERFFFDDIPIYAFLRFRYTPAHALDAQLACPDGVSRASICSARS